MSTAAGKSQFHGSYNLGITTFEYMELVEIRIPVL